MSIRLVALVMAFVSCVSLKSNNVTAQQGRVDSLVSVIDTDGDGKLQMREVQSATAAIRRLDADGNGIVSRDETSRSESSTRGQGDSSKLGGYTTPPPANNVPDHPFNILLGRLTDSSGTIRVLFRSDAKVYLTFGDHSGKHASRTEVQNLSAGEPLDFVIDSLARNSRCYYRLVYESNGRTLQSDEYSFHTQRGPDSPFVFTVQADSHLDENTSGEVYLRTLEGCNSSTR